MQGGRVLWVRWWASPPLTVRKSIAPVLIKGFGRGIAKLSRENQENFTFAKLKGALSEESVGRRVVAEGLRPSNTVSDPNVIRCFVSQRWPQWNVLRMVRPDFPQLGGRHPSTPALLTRCGASADCDLIHHDT